MMVGTVNNGQLALGQIEHIRKLTVQLQYTMSKIT